MLWADGSVRFLFGKGGSSILANCPLCGTEAILSFSADSVCSSFSVEACTILHALCLFSQHQQVCYSFFFSYLTLPVLTILFSSPSFLLSQSVWKIWQELFSLSSCSVTETSGLMSRLMLSFKITRATGSTQRL